MNRVVKIFALIAVAAVALFAVAVVFFLLFFDPNDFRDEISVAVKERTGRELTIGGDVSLAFFPWLAIELGHTTLGNATGFGDKPFAEFDRAKLSVRLLPMLLRREVSINTAELDTLKLNLEVDSRGRSNWDDFLTDDTPATAGTESAEGAAVEVSGVNVTNTTIVYRDRQSGDTYTLTEMNMQLGRVADDGRPVPANGTFHFDMQPTEISGDLELDTVVSFDTENARVSFDGMTIAGVVEGIASIPTRLEAETSGIEIQTENETATMQPLAIRILGIDIEAEVEPFSYSGDILPVAHIKVDAFSPRSLMTQLDIEVPVTADPAALSRVTVDAKAAVRPNLVQLGGVTITLDDTTFTGKLSVPRSTNGAYTFDLSADRIDLDRYMEPGADGDGGGADGAAPVEIPADLIRPLNARGDLRVKTALLSGMQFDNVVLGLNSANGRLRLNPVMADLFGGKYDGDVRIDASSSAAVLSVDEKIADVNLADLAQAMFEQDNITGTITGAFKLTGSGNDMAAVQQSLSGNMTFELKDGTYEGTDIWYELRRARALLKGGAAPEPQLPPRTRFSSVKASGIVNNGVMRNDDLRAELPFMQMTGSGNVDLVAATVNYNLTARVLERPESLQGVSAEELDDFTRAVIPLKITGPLSSPSVKPDVGQLLRDKVEKKVKDRLLDKLLGGDKPTAPETGDDEAAPEDGEAEEEPAEESVEDQLKDKLKGLFD